MSDINLWIEKLELYLDRFQINNKDKLYIATSYVNDECMRDLTSLKKLYEQENGFEDFKKALRSKFEKNRSKAEQMDIRSLTNRVQRENESCRAFGDELKRISKAVLGEENNQHLNKLFSEGLRDAELRAKAVEKANKKQENAVRFPSTNL